MKDKINGFLDFIIYWSIIAIPFFMAIAPAPMNVFLGFLIFAFLAKRALNRQSLFIRSPLNKPFMFFVIISLISVFNSVDYSDSMRGLLRLAYYWALFLIMAEEIKDDKHIKKIIFAMILGVSLLSVDAIWQVISGRDFIRGNIPIVNIGLKRATASFPDANVFGIYLSAIAPLLIGLALYYFKRKKKIAMSLVSILVLLGITLTYSRPTLLAIYIILLFLSIVKKDKILLAALIIFIFMAPFVMPRNVKNWAKEVDCNPIRFMCNDDRIAIYRSSLNMIKDHPVIGVGINTFMKNYKKYKECPEYRNTVTSDYIYAHNNFLHMAGEIGLVGLGVFAWLLYMLFSVSSRIYKRLKDPYLKTVALSLIACLIAFLVNGFTESSLYYSRVAMIFWYLIGFSLSLEKFTHEDRSERC